MSYQAIIDIIAPQPQIQDFQLSAAVNDSQESNPSISFAEILSSYNEDNKVETPKSNETETVKEPEKTVNTEEAEKISENQIENENVSEKNTEQTVDKTDLSESDKKIDDKKINTFKNTGKEKYESGVKEKKENSEPAKKSDKELKVEKKDKKLSDKDYSRLDELTEKVKNETDSSKLSVLAQNNTKTEDLKELKVQNKEEGEVELKVLPDSSSEITMNQISGDNKSETYDFNFSGKDEKNSKKFAFDKDGKITVEDQRTTIEPEHEVADSKKSVIKTGEIKLTNDSTAVMNVELNPNAEADVLSFNTQTAASNGSTFQAMLSNQLSNVAPEFVKAGNLVLKDNNQGTINLILHPDDLGNVKIHLSLDGKTLSGHITVATKEALQVFKDNAETLREAFIKNGFDSASFDVAMNNGGSFNQNMGFEGQDDGTSLFAKRAYGNSAGGLSAELDDILENTEDISNYSVNIVA